MLRWVLQVVLPAWISLMPNVATHFATGTLTWDTTIKGPDLLTFVMTVSVTSVIGLLSVSPSLSLASLKPWRVCLALFFVFVFPLAMVLRVFSAVGDPAAFNAFEVFRRAEKVELAGVFLAGMAVVATLTIMVIEICECIGCRSAREPL